MERRRRQREHDGSGAEPGHWQFVTHATLDDARTAIEEAIGDGVTVGHTNIWRRHREQWLLSPITYIEPGTSAAELPWARKPDPIAG